MALAKNEKLAKQRAKRKANGNSDAHKYEKTEKGFLMRVYRNMKSRVTGIQWKKAHLYFGKELLVKETFYEWSRASNDFQRLFKTWTEANYDRRICPSIDRIDSSKGYVLSNMRWITHSQNSALGSVSGNQQRKAVYKAAGVLINE